MENIANTAAAFRLTSEQLQDISQAMCRKIKEGLDEDGGEIKAIPAYLQQPAQGLKGRVLIVDIGGTNVRAAIVELFPDGTCEVKAGPLKDHIPSGRQGKPFSSQEFFAFQAKLALQLNPEPNLPVGYCFSYPAQSTPDSDASLIHWTKDIHVTNVEGRPVGKLLGEAFADLGYQTGKITVLNDTVAALLAGAGAHAQEFDKFIGLIAGTGTNMAGFVKVSPCNKLGALPWNKSTMAVNLESGNFTPPYLNAYDDLMDSQMDMPGRQRFEKALSGYYLPFLYAQACPEDKSFDPYEGSSVLTAKRDEENDEIAEAILTRSADLIAAGLAGFIKALGNEGHFCIAAEGSRYWADPLLAPYVQELLPKLVGPQVTFKIIKVDNANLLGAAYAALSHN
ncbi:hypothetical protein IJT93_06105 [bacterium]|nr:hypothetical protein [bacterium]